MNGTANISTDNDQEKLISTNSLDEGPMSETKRNLLEKDQEFRDDVRNGKKLDKMERYERKQADEVKFCLLKKFRSKKSSLSW